MNSTQPGTLFGVDVTVRREKIARTHHLEQIPDDPIPSMFGARVHYPAGVQDDPSIKEPSIQSIGEIARLRPPDRQRDGLRPWVLDVLHHAAETGEALVGLMDMPSHLEHHRPVALRSHQWHRQRWRDNLL